jgi:alpha-soluble NSF attachment protein
LANKNWLQFADLAAMTDDYYTAAKTYEDVAKYSISQALMKYSVKEYLFKAGLCRLATQDLVEAERELDGYRNMDPSFATTREHQLLVDLLAAIQAGNQDQFTDKLAAFDQMSKLDKWKTRILLKIKGMIQEAEDDFS